MTLSSKNREWQNMLRRCVDPGFAGRVSAFLMRKTVARIKNNFGPASQRYPPAVRRAFENQRPRGSTTIAPISVDLASYQAGVRDQLKLASGYLSFEDHPRWTEGFSDVEQTVSLHRWGWLLIRLTDDPSPDARDWGLRLMRSWLHDMSYPVADPAWESYTIGERICNAVLFLTLTETGVAALAELPEDLHEALALKARILSERLEYNEPEWTGNHVLNNARALYFAGQALHNDYFSKLAIAILRNDLGRFVYQDGFLREGSSHYHFLVTRWLLEVLWLARLSGDRDMSNLIEPVTRLMVERCWFFLVLNKDKDDWVMPLIGDVSPDFSWRWLLNLPWSNLAISLYQPGRLPRPPNSNGWGNLFGLSSLEASSTCHDSYLHEFSESGWYRLGTGPLTIFWHVEPQGAPPFVSHGHCDIGSLCVYWKGVEIITDPGRLNYVAEDSLGKYGASARAHSTALVDGFEPFVYESRNRYPPVYRRGEVGMTCEKSSGGFQVTLCHSGFSRLNGDPIIFQRIFRLSANQLVIEDRIDGHSRHLIESYFQWGPSVQINARGDLTFGITDEKTLFDGIFSACPARQEHAVEYKLLRGLCEPEPAGWHFPEYGEKVETSTLLFQVRVTLPYECKYFLSWVN